MNALTQGTSPSDQIHEDATDALPTLLDEPTSRPASRVRQGVLVVDDDREIRGVLHDLFDGEGYQVYEAADGEEGLKLLAAASAPLVVLLDLMMPGVDGFEVCRRLMADARLRNHHAIILMSARRNLQLADCSAAQATMPKPFEVDDLLELVEQLANQPLPPDTNGGTLGASPVD